MDHILTFYAPVETKDVIGAVIKTPTAQTPTLRAERIFKSSAERFEAKQPVGITTQDFRVYDRILSIEYEWEFDAYQISAPSSVKRYKVTGIEREGRGNTLRITGEVRDNS